MSESDETMVGSELEERSRQTLQWQRAMLVTRLLAWATVGFAVGGSLFFVCGLSTGGGHGSYLMFAWLFPFPMTIGRMTGHEYGYITNLVLVAALSQFPLYAVLVAIWGMWNVRLAAALVILAIHLFSASRIVPMF